MSFKPKQQDRPQGGSFEDTRNHPVPRAGSRKARVSLIIDLGTQDRDDFEEPDGTLKPQKPCQQVVVFADLVADNVDYGGKIGRQQYRMLLNKSFQNVIQGINFTTVSPKDAKGNVMEGKPWTLHPANLLTKLAKATGNEHIIYDDNKKDSLDISLLLNEPFMCQVEVKETEGKKKDKDGNAIIYKNVNFKGAAPIPEDDDGEPLDVAELKQTPRCITFDNATVEDIQYIRASILNTIKKANDYVGSQMQKAIEAYEAANSGDSGEDDGEQEQEEKPTPKVTTKAPAKKAVKTAEKKRPASAPPPDDDMDDDIPF